MGPMPNESPSGEALIATARRVLSMEQDALGALSRGLGQDFVQAVETILAAKGRVICTGIGKSGHVARKMAATFASTGTQAYFVHANEASHGDLGMISPGDVVIALSKSGESNELTDILHYTRRFGIPLIAMTAKPTSTLGAAATIRLLIPDAPEACAETNAPTTSTTLMLALGDALAVALLESRGFKADQFKVYHPGGKLGAMLRTAGDVMHTSAELPVVASGMAFIDAVNAMTKKGFGVLGVTTPDGKLAGMVTDGDLRRYLTSGSKAETIDEVMTRAPRTAEPGTLAADLLRTMNERKITQIFVLDAGKPVGLIHMHDLLKAGIA
ncbi:MAG TPA: KpsF/GutQ family sugar-phosphate isomerase [Hyphomonadaceae bacterium]|nr:KpsF/GutQ family sugar-phosphate isomerase [Hyphomonadaceae bacterium]